MAIKTVPLFSTDRTDFTWSSTGGTITGELITYDDPPTALRNVSICIAQSTTSGTDTITVKCQMYFKVGNGSLWGGLKTVVDEDAADITFSTGTDTNSTSANIVANLYNQDWWGPNDGFRIVLTGNGSETIGGTACAVVQ